MSESWEAVYRGELHSLWGLIVVPGLFLSWLAVRGAPASDGADPRAARFVRLWAAVFALESIVDPVATTSGVSMLPFVLLGDARVFLLVLVVASPARPLATTIAAAAAWTLVVPITAWSVYRVLDLVTGPLPEAILWLVYECLFIVIAVIFRSRIVPARKPVALGYLRAVLAYVVGYYVLWAIADVLILSGRDVGWALRIVPNQLYYALSVPLAYGLFFAPRFAVTAQATPAREAG